MKTTTEARLYHELLDAAIESNARRGWCTGACSRYRRTATPSSLVEYDDDGYPLNRTTTEDLGDDHCDCGHVKLRRAIEAIQRATR